MELKETFVSRQEIFHGRIVDLRVDTVRLPNGHLTTREVIDHPGGVAVVAIDENDNVLTVKQYRYAFQTVLEEIPAGKLERGEDPAAAARRELSEETGACPAGHKLPSKRGWRELRDAHLPRRDPRLPRRLHGGTAPLHGHGPDLRLPAPG